MDALEGRWTIDYSICVDSIHIPNFIFVVPVYIKAATSGICYDKNCW
jgi:hypothetical protein